jgi:Fe-S oxidoreductase
VEYNRFQPYSAGGRLAASLSFLEGRSGYTERFVDIANNCLLCGLCDVSCKVCRYNMEPLQAMKELRAKLVSDGQVLPQHTKLIQSLNENHNLMLQPQTARGNWTAGLKIKDLNKEKSEVVFHAGCRISYDAELRQTAVNAAWILASWGPVNRAAAAELTIWVIAKISPNAPPGISQPGKRPG